MKFIGIWILLSCFVACQSSNNANSSSKVKAENFEDIAITAGDNNGEQEVSKNKKTTKTNKFFEYNDGCHYNVILKGAIFGKPDNYVAISKPDFLGKSKKQKLNINENKKFKGSINIDEPAFYQFHHKQNNYLTYLTPGDHLDIDINHATDQGLTFNGSSKAINNFLRCNHLQQKSFEKTANKNLKLKYAEFEKTVEYERIVLKNSLIETIENADSINARFVALQNMAIDFDWALKHLKYQKYNFKDPRANYHSNGKYLNELSFYSEFLELSSFRKFVYSYFDFFSHQYIDDTYGEEGKYEYSPEERTTMRYNRVNFMFKDLQIRDFVKTKLLEETINDVKSPLYGKLPVINKLVAKHKKEVEDKVYIQHIHKCYHKNIPVDDGTIAPDFMVKNANGDSLQLDDLKGKWAYIAVWATWCAPCKIEQPHLEILKQEYAKNKNIEIFSVSIDEETDRWKNAISDGNITDPQYIAPGNWNSDFASAFNLTSVPKYILIDPEGQINDLSTSKPSADIRLKFDHLGI